jgi:Protein of unknown function (DUF3795)
MHVENEWASLAKMNFISRCGIYCGACYVYCASRDGGEFMDYISKQTETPKEQIKCAGCLGAEEELWKNCRKCGIRACLKEKGLQFCYECAKLDEGCERYERLKKGCFERGEDARESLRRIQSGEAEAWLKEQDAKWRCPTCNKSISWYEETCHHCGKPLKS